METSILLNEINKELPKDIKNLIYNEFAKDKCYKCGATDMSVKFYYYAEDQTKTKFVMTCSQSDVNNVVPCVNTILFTERYSNKKILEKTKKELFQICVDKTMENFRSIIPKRLFDEAPDNIPLASPLHGELDTKIYVSFIIFDKCIHQVMHQTMNALIFNNCFSSSFYEIYQIPGNYNDFSNITEKHEFSDF